MRKPLLSLLAVLCCTALSAQQLGLRLGISATDANYNFENSELETEEQVNYLLGVFVNLPLGTDLISIQPEFTYLGRGYNVGADFGDFLAFKRTLTYVDLGVLARLNVGFNNILGFYVGAGPQFSYAVSGTYSDALGERDVNFESDRLNRGEFQFAVASGLTVDIGLKLFVEGRYTGSLGNQSDSNFEDIRQRSGSVNCGIMIPF